VGAFTSAPGPQGVSFYSLDDPASCEGVGAGPGQDAAVQQRSVQDYLSDGAALPPRLASAQWWQSLATAWACSGVEERVARLGKRAQPPSWLPAVPSPPAPGMPSPFLIALRARLREIWYASRGGPWGAAAEAAIQEETQALFNNVEFHVKAVS
jgi:hypothetical protein